MVDGALVEIQLRMFGFLDHPVQRDLCQTALRFWIPAAYIAVRADKPDFFCILFLLGICVETLWSEDTTGLP